MRRRAVEVDAHLGPGGGEVEEDLGVDVGEGTGAPLLGQVVDGGGRGVAGVVPAPEGDEQDGPSGRSGWADQRRWGRLRPKGPASAQAIGATADGAGPGTAAVGAYAGPMSSVEIVEATEVTPELVAAFQRLIPQLSSSNPPPTEAELEAIVASEASILLLAVDRDADDAVARQPHAGLVPHPHRRAGLDRGRGRRRRRPGQGRGRGAEPATPSSGPGRWAPRRST